MKTLQVSLLVVIAITLLTALKPYHYRNDLNTPLIPKDPFEICFSIDSAELANWIIQGGEKPVVFPVKKTVGSKEDFALACRTLKENFLVGGKPVTEKEFRVLAGNYVLYLKKNGVIQSQVATGYRLDVGKKNHVTLCIYPKTQEMVLRRSLPPSDTVCCRCPPVCADFQFQKVVGEVIQKQYQ